MFVELLSLVVIHMYLLCVLVSPVITRLFSFSLLVKKVKGLNAFHFLAFTYKTQQTKKTPHLNLFLFLLMDMHFSRTHETMYPKITFSGWSCHRYSNYCPARVDLIKQVVYFVIINFQSYLFLISTYIATTYLSSLKIHPKSKL